MGLADKTRKVSTTVIPLSTPIIPLDPASPERTRYQRNWQVDGIGLVGQARLKAARVLVIGAGGLGSAVLPYLAGAGVGTLGISDGDVVELSNLQRQIIHAETSVGMAKTQSAIEHVHRLNSGVAVTPIGTVTDALLDEIGDEWDLVLDCTDAFASKYLIADWCAANHKPLVWGTVVGMTYQTSVFWTAAPAPWPSTSLRQLYPTIPEPGTTPRASEQGVLGSVVGQVGTIMATEAIKLITGVGEPLIGRVLIGDARTQSISILPFATGGNS